MANTTAELEQLLMQRSLTDTQLQAAAVVGQPRPSPGQRAFAEQYGMQVVRLSRIMGSRAGSKHAIRCYDAKQKSSCQTWRR